MAQKPHSLEHTIWDKKLNLVIHYTCNPPELKALEKHNIGTFGELYECEDKREVLAIPSELYNQYGKTISEDPAVLTLQSEYLLKKIDREHKKTKGTKRTIDSYLS